MARKFCTRRRRVLEALIGVGGLGELILSGLNLNDAAPILQEAVPAALLARPMRFLFVRPVSIVLASAPLARFSPCW